MIISNSITIAAADTISSIALSFAVALDTVGVLLVIILILDITIASVGMLLFTVEDGDTIATIIDGLDNGDVMVPIGLIEDGDFKALVEVVDTKVSEIGGISTEVIFDDSTLASDTDVYWPARLILLLELVVTGDEYGTCWLGVGLIVKRAISVLLMEGFKSNVEDETETCGGLSAQSVSDTDLVPIQRPSPTLYEYGSFMVNMLLIPSSTWF